MAEMKTRFLSAVSLTVSLATAACAPAVRWSEPATPASSSADSYVDSNMLTLAQRRMAVPEGWSFRRKKDSDAKQIMFWIHDTGGNSVTGAYAFEHIGFSIGGPRATERLAQFKMKNFSDIVAQRTEIDNTEAYIVQGANEPKSLRKITGWVFGHPNTGTDLSDISFIGDRAYVDQNQRVLYTILNTFKVMPRGLSERKLKGSFSFRCDDGAFGWVDDVAGRWQQKGFAVAGPVDDNGGLVVSIRQVMTTRFADFIKMDLFNPREFETVLHFAGNSFPARAIHRNDPDKKIASTVLLFKHEGKDYMLELFRSFKTHPETIDPAMHDAPATRAALDSKFYFYN
jgi:proteasome lid subunit RPN8/RPN11